MAEEEAPHSGGRGLPLGGAIALIILLFAVFIGSTVAFFYFLHRRRERRAMLLVPVVVDPQHNTELAPQFPAVEGYYAPEAQAPAPAAGAAIGSEARQQLGGYYEPPPPHQQYQGPVQQPVQQPAAKQVFA